MTNFKEQKYKVELLESQLERENEILQEICSHENIKYYSSSVDFQGYDRDYSPAVIKCDACGLYLKEKDKHFLEIKRKYKL